MTCKSTPLELSVSNIPEFLGDRRSHWQLRRSLAFQNELSSGKMIVLRSLLGAITSHFSLLETVILMLIIMELSIQPSPLNYHFFKLLYEFNFFFY